jgi:hypothetical protein
MSLSSWKSAERRAAAIIGGRRVWQKFSAGDAESEAFVADAKRRRTYTQRQMREDLAKLEANPETGSRTAVLVLFDIPGRGRKGGEPLVVMTATAFQAWHRPSGEEETTTMADGLPAAPEREQRANLSNYIRATDGVDHA